MAKPAPELHSLREAFLAGIDVSKNLAKACPAFPRRIETLIDLVKEKLSGEKPFLIHFHPRNYQSHTFIGTIEAFEDHAHIFYDRDRNLCWRRMIITKELCHLLYVALGEKHLASTPEQIEYVINKIMAGLDKVDLWNDHLVSTESCTVLIALEVLLPHNERPKIEAEMASGKNITDIATAYRVPVAMVRQYLSADYKKWLDHCYELAAVPRKKAA